MTQNISDTKNRTRSLFIVLEGGEASGKSTMAKKLAAYFTRRGQTVCLTREPGGISAAEEIRTILLKDRSQADKLDGYTEALLFAAARNEHLKKTVLPALDRGEVVIMDRYYYSSLAYQGEGRMIGYDVVKEMNSVFLRPDYAFYLKIRPFVQRQRLNRRKSSEKNHLDRETDAFMKRVASGFERCIDEFDEFVAVNGNKRIEDVFRDIVSHLEKSQRQAG